MKACNHCSNLFEGNFCPNCGKPAGGSSTMMFATASTNTAKIDVVDSKFTGNTWSLFGINLLTFIGSIFTLFIAFPWLVCLKKRYIASHTYINGKQQCFNGTGIQLIGKFLLWAFLTLITCGIFIFWASYNLHKWTVKHTYFVGEEYNKSNFDGNAAAYIGNNILAIFLNIITLGFVGTWMRCRKERFLNNHCIVSGYRLNFCGNGGDLLGKYLLWGVLTVLTLGIYGIFRAMAYKKWLIKHTKISYTEPTMTLSQEQINEYKRLIKSKSPENNYGISFTPSKVFKNVIGTAASFFSEVKVVSCMEASLEILKNPHEKEYVNSLLELNSTTIKKIIKELNNKLNIYN